MNKQVKELKNMLKLHGVTLVKPAGEWVMRVYIEDLKQDLIYLAPECENGEFLDAHEVVKFNKILFFEMSWENYTSNDPKFLNKFAIATSIAAEAVNEFNRTWTGKDFRDFAKLDIKIKR